MSNAIYILGQPTSWLEIAAMLSGVAGVWLTMREKIWCFPVGILNVTLYAILFFSPDVRLYADAILQCLYILLLIYGWYKWSDRNKKQKVILPSYINKQTGIRLAIVLVLSSLAFSYFLVNFTNASYPRLDSVLTCASLCAQWMIARKIIENWIVWIIVNLVYIPLYVSKQLPLTAILYSIFLILAVRGYLEWKKHIYRA